ncbi:MAG: hypothetical protein HZA54_09905 [Planctomycetes bacterium]|nr:hypothetical protein [Planctomycetota bacterium]
MLDRLFYVALALCGAPAAIPAWWRGGERTRAAALVALLAHLLLLAPLNAVRAVLFLAEAGNEACLERARATVFGRPMAEVGEAFALALWGLLAVAAVCAPRTTARVPLVGGLLRLLERILVGLRRFLDEGRSEVNGTTEAQRPRDDAGKAEQAVPPCSLPLEPGGGDAERPAPPSRRLCVSVPRWFRFCRALQDLPRPSPMPWRVGIAVLLLAFALRAPLLTWGLPLAAHRQQIHPDEWGVACHAESWPLTGPLAIVPQYPSLLGALIANGTPGGAIAQTWTKIHLDATRERLGTLLLGRAWNLLLALLGVAALLGAAHELFPGDRLALLVAGVGGACALWLLHATGFLTGDAAAAAWFACALWGAARIARRGDRRDYLLAGLAAGAAVATKYAGGLATVAVALGGVLDLVRRRRAAGSAGWLRHALLAATACALVFLLGNPVVLFHPGAWIERMAQEGDIIGNHGAMPAAEYLAWIGTSFWTLLGAPLAVLAVPTCVGWSRRAGAALLLAGVPLVLFLVAARGYYERHALVVLPCAFLLLAAGVAGLATRPRRLSWLRGAVLPLLALAVLLALGSVVQRAADVRQSVEVVVALSLRLDPGTRLALPYRPEYYPAILRSDVTVQNLYELGAPGREPVGPPDYLLLDDEYLAFIGSLLSLVDPATYVLPPTELWRVFQGQPPPPPVLRLLAPLVRDPAAAPYRAILRWEQPLAALPIRRLEFFPLGFTLYERVGR